MTTELVTKSLGEAGVEFARQTLINGLSLARRVLDRCAWISSGSTLTLVPKDFRGGRLFDFESGFVEPLAGDTESWVSDRIVSYLKGPPPRVALFENAYLSTGDSQIETAKTEIWVYGREVYHLISPDRATVDFVRLTIREADSLWILVGVLSRADPPHMTDGRRELTATDLDRFADKSDMLVFQAYDGYSFVVCERC